MGGGREVGEIKSLSDYRSEPCERHDMRLRRLAIQIAAQLPEDVGDALATLDLAKTLVRSFMGDPKPS